MLGGPRVRPMVRLTVVCACLLSPVIAVAQPVPTASRTRIGVGAAIRQQGNLLTEVILPPGAFGPTVFLTIDRPSWPRIEAEFGFLRASNVEVTEFVEVTGFGRAQTSTDSFTIATSQVGVGVMPRHVVGDFGLYYGGRVGFLRTSTLETFDGRIGSSGFRVADLDACGGLEWVRVASPDAGP